MKSGLAIYLHLIELRQKQEIHPSFALGLNPSDERPSCQRLPTHRDGRYFRVHVKPSFYSIRYSCGSAPSSSAKHFLHPIKFSTCAWNKQSETWIFTLCWCRHLETPAIRPRQWRQGAARTLARAYENSRGMSWQEAFQLEIDVVLLRTDRWLQTKGTTVFVRREQEVFKLWS